MPVEKTPRPTFDSGLTYCRGIFTLFASATFPSAVRWPEDYHLFILGALSYDDTASFA